MTNSTTTPLGQDEAAVPPSAYPNQREAARMLGISESTLSRRSDLATIPVGERERRYPTVSVLGAASFYKKRTLNQVAGDLLSHAAAADPAYRDLVQEEIDHYFKQRVPPLDPQRFLDEARRTLPRHLYDRVLQTYQVGLPTATQLSSKASKDAASDTLT